MIDKKLIAIYPLFLFVYWIAYILLRLDRLDALLLFCGVGLAAFLTVVVVAELIKRGGKVVCFDRSIVYSVAGCKIFMDFDKISRVDVAGIFSKKLIVQGEIIVTDADSCKMTDKAVIYASRHFDLDGLRDRMSEKWLGKYRFETFDVS